MYAYIKGSLASFTPSYAIVDVHGIGYHLLIPCNAFLQLPQLGEQVHFYTSFVVREFSQAIYGFLSAQERDCFEVLMNISGIGPKTALNLIGHLPGDNLHYAISQEDLMTLCKVPGIGKKTAERLLVELRDKLPALSFTKQAELAITLPKDPKLLKTQDAILALINLGYTQQVAQKAVRMSLKELSEETDLASLITVSLKHIQK